VRAYSQILTRLGDLDLKAGDRLSSTQRYESLLRLSIEVFRRTPDDPKAIREVAWALRKLGELQSDPEAVVRDFSDEVCVRRDGGARADQKRQRIF
jgi:hypothetical protein